jgi:hypothetical protein
VGSIPLADGRLAWFKACRPVQGFEPGLTAELASRWPDRVVEVIAHDAARGWLLTLDAGSPLDDFGNPPERWDELLPRYAELQRGETERAAQHLAAGVPDLRLVRLRAEFERLLAQALPLAGVEIEAARRLGPRLDALVAELAGAGVGDTVDHADLHHRSVFADAERLRILDWGDASISHPFFTLAVTFHWLREVNRLPAGDGWFARLRDAYLEPWGPGLEPAFALAQRLGRVGRALAWLRHRTAMGPGTFPGFDAEWPGVLRAAFEALRG